MVIIITWTIQDYSTQRKDKNELNVMRNKIIMK
jgi:hypothetical protein